MASQDERRSPAGARAAEPGRYTTDTQSSSTENGQTTNNDSGMSLFHPHASNTPAPPLTISPAVARVLMSARQSSETRSETKLVHHGGSEGLVFFPQLKHHACFSTLKETLETYSDSYDERLLKTISPVRVPIEAVLALSMNDYTAENNIPGRMRHSWGDQIAYFAYRAWATRELEEYKRLTPLVRVKISSAFSPFHWERPDTPVIRILVLNSPLSGLSDVVELGFYVPGADLDDAVKRTKSAILLWTGRKLLFFTFADLVSSSLQQEQLPQSGLEKLQSPPLLRLKVCESKECHKEGYIHLEWTYGNVFEQSAWARSREVVGIDLQVALQLRLNEEIFNEGEDSLVQDLGTEYDMLFPGE